ncbi:MAG: hypothetical protein AB7T31_15070 [Gemmatimonadales bacterium]
MRYGAQGRCDSGDDEIIVGDVTTTPTGFGAEPEPGSFEDLYAEGPAPVVNLALEYGPSSSDGPGLGTTVNRISWALLLGAFAVVVLPQLIRGPRPAR